MQEGTLTLLLEMAERGRAELAGQQRRNLAGRIRAMILRWSDIWASLGLWDAQTDAAVRFCLEALREAERCARRCPDQRSAAQIVSALRACALEAHDTTKPVYVQAADELEAIVRVGEPPGAR